MEESPPTPPPSAFRTMSHVHRRGLQPAVAGALTGGPRALCSTNHQRQKRTPTPRTTPNLHHPSPPHCLRTTIKTCLPAIVLSQLHGVHVQGRGIHVYMCKAGGLQVYMEKQGACIMHAGAAVMRHCAQSRSYLSMPCTCICLADMSSVDRRTIAVILQQPNPPPPEDAQQHTNNTRAKTHRRPHCPG